MTILAAAAVRTTGINWQSVAVICGVVVTAITAAFTMLARITNRREQRLLGIRKTADELTARNEADAGKAAAEVVAARLEKMMTSKFRTVTDHLGRQDHHLERQDQRIQALGERTAHIEGQLEAARKERENETT